MDKSKYNKGQEDYHEQSHKGAYLGRPKNSKSKALAKKKEGKIADWAKSKKAGKHLHQVDHREIGLS